MQAVTQLLRRDALRLGAHLQQGRQPAAHRPATQHRSQHRSPSHKPPQGVQKRLHERLVVANVNGSGHKHFGALTLRVFHRSGQACGQHPVGVRLQRPQHRPRQRLAGLSHHLLRVKTGVRRGKQHALVSIKQQHLQPMVPHQRARQLVRQPGQVLRRGDILQSLGDQLHLAGEHVHVQVFKVLLHRPRHHRSQPQQHGAGNGHKQQGQALRQGQCFEPWCVQCTHSGGSST